MRLSRTLSLYFARQFLVAILGMLLGLMLLVFLGELVEILRRGATRTDLTFGLVLEMALLKLPLMAQKMIAFAALFGGLFAFSRLNRTNELVAARAAGVSVWQFLTPAMAVATGIGVVIVTLFSPIASATLARYEQLEAKFLKGRASLMAVSSSGLWLRQADADGQSVIHALRVSDQGTQLFDVIIFVFRGSDQFVRRFDAREARLHDGYWELFEALESRTQPEPATLAHDRVELPTRLTLREIQNSFAAPETLSFWALPGFIQSLEAAGFSALRHRLHWHASLALPLLLGAMILIAAIFSQRLTRRGGLLTLAAAGIATGFLLYFVTDLVHALGQSGSVPVALAAWTPAGVAALLGVTTIFHLEDG